MDRTIWLRLIAFSLLLFSGRATSQDEGTSSLGFLADTNVVHLAPSGLSNHFLMVAGFDTVSMSETRLILEGRLRPESDIQLLRVEYSPLENGKWGFQYLVYRGQLKRERAEGTLMKTLGKPAFQSEGGTTSWDFADGYGLVLECSGSECSVEISMTEEYD